MIDIHPGTPSRLPLLQVTICILFPFATGYYLSYLTRTIGAVISGRMVAQLHLTPADLGVLTSSYFFTFAIAQLPLGIALDRYGPRLVQVVLLPLAAVGAALFAIGHDLTMLVLARGLMGLGVAGALMAGLKAIRQFFPPERIALANGILIMFGAFGAVTATAPAELLLRMVGWRGLFLLVAIVTVISTLLIAIVTPRRAAQAARIAGPTPVQPTLSSIYLDVRFWHLAPMSACLIGTSFAMQGLWAAPWLTDVVRLDRRALVGALFAMALALCAGALGLGIIADRLRGLGVTSRQMLVVMTVLAIAAQLALVLRAPLPPLLPWLVLAVAASATVLSYAAMAEVFPSNAAGRANSALNVLHIGAAFAIQGGIGVIVGDWATHGAGHSPAIAYETAFAINLLPQCLALGWFLIAPVLAKRRPATHGAAARAAYQRVVVVHDERPLSDRSRL